jgi:TonB family protein
MSREGGFLKRVNQALSLLVGAWCNLKVAHFNWMLSVHSWRETKYTGLNMRSILGSLLFLCAFSVDDPTTRQPVATHVESIGYPDIARDAQIQGLVDMQLIISSDGLVSSANAISGHPVLKQAAEKNIRRWKFDPSSAGGRLLTVKYEFRLELPRTYYRPESQNIFELPTRVTVISNFPEPQP